MREFWEKLRGRYTAVKVRMTLKPLVIAMAFVLVAVVSCLSCTEQQRAKNFGGSMTVKIPAGHKLVTATWKVDNLWYLTRPMRPGESAEEYKFTEKGSFGLLEGTVVFKETVR